MQHKSTKSIQTAIPKAKQKQINRTRIKQNYKVSIKQHTQHKRKQQSKPTETQNWQTNNLITQNHKLTLSAKPHLQVPEIKSTKATKQTKPQALQVNT